MDNNLESNNKFQAKKEIKFDLSQALLKIDQFIDVKSQEQLALYKNLILNLNLNPRQKLKHYKKVLQSGEKQNLGKQKDFINNYFKRVLLQEYMVGNTETKLSLSNLLRKLTILTYQNIIQAKNNIQFTDFEQVKSWSQIIDLVSRVYHQKPTKQQFQSVQQILYGLQDQIIQGQLMISRNQFKTKWLGIFTEKLRTENLLVRVFGEFLIEQNKVKLIQACRKMILKTSLLSKQVISQLFLLQIYLSPQQPQPEIEDFLSVIHYYHAQSVVLGKNTLKSLVALIPKLKQTQQKFQLVLILQQSFIEHYAKLNTQEQKNFRLNVFDQVINFFEVGRSIYGYLQTIVKIIIQNGDDWNMEGNFVRKFFIATIALKILPSKQVLDQWPTIVQDLIVQCGNISVPYAADCAKLLFQRLYQQNQKDYKKWSSLWIDSYRSKLLNSKEKGSIRGIIEFINPILLKICSKPYLLRDLLTLSQKQSNSHIQLGIISLIKCYRQIGQIQVNEKDQMFNHVEDKTIGFGYLRIRNLLLSNDQMIAIQALQLVCCSLKPSDLIRPMQMKLILQFFVNSLKTSLPEYRKNYLGITRKLFDRFRNIYDSHLVVNLSDKKPTKKQFFSDFVNFLKQLVKICFKNIYPDAIFQLVNPALEILQLLQNYFGNHKIQNKKGMFLEPTFILKETSFYEFRSFQSLLSCLQSSYESVRKMAHDLLNLFNQIQSKQLLLDLWQKSLQNTNKLAIRGYEYACRVLTYISEIYPNILNIEQKYNLDELNTLNYFLKLTKERYLIFKHQFISQGANYYNNLIHGLLTIFSFQIDKLALKMGDQAIYSLKFAEFKSEIKQFMEEFFTELINMLNFAVQISSSNVSTVVLDTLAQGSQTDKKLKVDCRGHFLAQNVQKTTNIGTFLESTALISSMQDDEEGIQNTLVVSFYLLTRQAGLVFQSIGGLMSNQNSNDYLPLEHLKRLITTYFFSLVNLKHMGSVDRISKGLGKMARVIFDHESKELSDLPQILLNKLLDHLKEGSFTNILRRSAGVPYAFCCLLKSQSLKRNKLIERAVTELLTLSNESLSNSIQLRVHALNILKKLFQDSDLKGDIDPYVSDAFISSIKGFTSEEWGVRNSSLMLFTVLANRTVGVKPTFNLLQFFIKCPSLFDFIQNQLNNFTEASLNTMYPPLYPIVLLFSRLLPFDVKQKSRLIPHGSMKNLKKQELLSLLPILDRSGQNNNFMGRVMTAKAILPFMQIDEINSYCVQGIERLVQYFTRDNNMLHYQLTKYHHLLISYKQICKNSMRSLEIAQSTLEKLWIFIDKQAQTIALLDCPVILEAFIKIFHYFFQNFNQHMKKQFGQNYNKIVDKLCTILRNISKTYVFETSRFIIPGDLGHSRLRKQAVSFEFDLLVKYTNQFQEFKSLALKFTQFLSKKLEENQTFFQSSDNEISEIYLQEIMDNIQVLKENQKNELLKSMTHMLQKLELNKIRSDIILSKVLGLRISVNYVSAKKNDQINYLVKVIKQSNNHFLKIAIFKYLDFVQICQNEIQRLLLQFSNPNSLQEMRQCAVEYLQTRQTFNDRLNIVHIRLLEDEEYEIRKQTTKILSKQLKIYSFNQNVMKAVVLKQISLSDLTLMLHDNSDFNIKRKNHEEQRIFAYDKPNKYRSDINTLVEALSNNQGFLQKMKQVSTVFENSLNEKEKQLNVVEIYQNNILLRNQYQFELIIRLMVSNLSKSSQQHKNVQNSDKISKVHPLFQEVFLKLTNLNENPIVK